MRGPLSLARLLLFSSIASFSVVEALMGLLASSSLGRWVGGWVGGWVSYAIVAFFVDRFVFGGRGFDGTARVLLPRSGGPSSHPPTHPPTHLFSPTYPSICRYKERIIRHEAGHFLLAYLLGCPVQNCLLRPVFNGATFGEAGTIFLVCMENTHPPTHPPTYQTKRGPHKQDLLLLH